MKVFDRKMTIGIISGLSSRFTESPLCDWRPSPPGTAALPLNQRGIDVNLPPPAPHNDAQPPTPQIVLEYTGDKRLSINNQDVAPSDLEARLRVVFETRTDKTLFLMGAGTLRYGEIVQVIDAAKGAGVQRVGVVTESMRRQ